MLPLSCACLWNRVLLQISTASFDNRKPSAMILEELDNVTRPCL